MCSPIGLMLSTLILNNQRKTIANANISQLTLVTFLHNAIGFQVCSKWCH